MAESKSSVRCTKIGKPIVDLSAIPAEVDPRKLRVKYFSFIDLYPSDNKIGIEVMQVYIYTEGEIFKCRMGNEYQVENLQDMMSVDGDNRRLVMSSSVLEDLVTVSYNTARGLLSAELRGTPLEPFPFPLARPKDLLSRLTVNII